MITGRNVYVKPFYRVLANTLIFVTCFYFLSFPVILLCKKRKLTYTWFLPKFFTKMCETLDSRVIAQHLFIVVEIVVLSLTLLYLILTRGAPRLSVALSFKSMKAFLSLRTPCFFNLLLLYMLIFQTFCHS